MALALLLNIIANMILIMWIISLTISRTKDREAMSMAVTTIDHVTECVEQNRDIPVDPTWLSNMLCRISENLTDHED